MEEGISVPDRVHIVPLGYERDRILEPLDGLKADEVILLSHEQEEEPPYLRQVREELRRHSRISLEEWECDIFDMYETIGIIAELADVHRDDDVYVNLATGSKVTAIGGMIACMLTEATPYYVRAESYGGEGDSPPDEPVSSGVAGIDSLPSYHIEAPPAEQIEILRYISEHGPVRKGELIDYGEEAALPFLADHSAANRNAEYRLLDNHIITPLRDRGDVTTEEVGRRTEVRITEDGQNTLRAFEYLLDEQDW